MIICYKSHACPVNIFYTKPRVETVVKRMKYVFLLLTLNIFNIFFLVFLLLTLKKYMLAGCTTASNLLLLFKYCWNINVIKTSRHNVDITTWNKYSAVNFVSKIVVLSCRCCNLFPVMGRANEGVIFLIFKINQKVSNELNLIFRCCFV